jgi:predicted Zn-dependent protease
VAAAAFAAIGLVGNNALSRSESAREDHNWSKALSEARLARAWMPWSPKPWEALGRAQLGAGAPTQARKSLRKAISMDRGDWELWYYLASASNAEARTAALRNAMRLFPHAQLLPNPPDARGSNP